MIRNVLFAVAGWSRCNIWAKSNRHPLTHLNTYVVLNIYIQQKRFPIDQGIDSKETRRGEFWREPLKRKHVRTWSNKLDSYNVDFLDSLNKSFKSWKVHYRCDAKLISLKFRVEEESAESVKSLCSLFNFIPTDFLHSTFPTLNVTNLSIKKKLNQIV